MMEITQGWIDGLLEARKKVNEHLENGTLDTLKAEGDVSFLLGYINSAKYLKVKEYKWKE